MLRNVLKTAGFMMVVALGVAAMPGCSSPDVGEEEGTNHSAQKKKKSGDEEPIAGGDRTLSVRATTIDETKILVCQDKDPAGYDALTGFKNAPADYVHHATPDGGNKWPVTLRLPDGDITVFALERPSGWMVDGCYSVSIEPSDEYKARAKARMDQLQNCLGVIPIIGTALGVLQLVEALEERDAVGVGLNGAGLVLEVLERFGKGIPLAGQLLSLGQCVNSFYALYPIVEKVLPQLEEIASNDSKPGKEQPLPESPRTGDDCADGKIGSKDKICGRSEGTEHILYGCAKGQWFEREVCANGCAPTDGVNDYCSNPPGGGD